MSKETKSYGFVYNTSSNNGSSLIINPFPVVSRSSIEKRMKFHNLLYKYHHCKNVREKKSVYRKLYLMAIKDPQLIKIGYERYPLHSIEEDMIQDYILTKKLNKTNFREFLRYARVDYEIRKGKKIVGRYGDKIVIN